MTALAPQLEPRAAEAARQLFEAHRQRILGYCIGRLGNRQDAEDAVQTTFMYAFKSLERGVVPETELAWLVTIAQNVCRTRRRSLGRRRRMEAPVDFDSCESVLAAPERSDSELLGLSRALAAMPKGQRSALLLREWQGLSYAEIAEKLAISQSAVETLLFRARRTLASQLTRIPRQVAVFANLPLLLRLARRLVPTAGAVKTTAAVVAIGAASTAGGLEIEHATGKSAARRAHIAERAHARLPSAALQHRLAPIEPAPPRRSRPHRSEAPRGAEAAPPVPAKLRATPPAASAPPPPRETPAAPAAAAQAAPVQPTPAAEAAPALPAVPAAPAVRPPLPDSTAAVASPVQSQVETAAGLANAAVTTVTSVVQEVAPPVDLSQLPPPVPDPAHLLSP